LEASGYWIALKLVEDFAYLNLVNPGDSAPDTIIFATRDSPATVRGTWRSVDGFQSLIPWWVLVRILAQVTYYGSRWNCW